jgi:hypothetical protein
MWHVWGEEMHTMLWRYLRIKGPLKNISVGGRIILKCQLDGRAMTGTL